MKRLVPDELNALEAQNQVLKRTLNRTRGKLSILGKLTSSTFMMTLMLIPLSLIAFLNLRTYNKQELIASVIQSSTYGPAQGSGCKITLENTAPKRCLVAIECGRWNNRATHSCWYEKKQLVIESEGPSRKEALRFVQETRTLAIVDRHGHPIRFVIHEAEPGKGLLD